MVGRRERGTLPDSRENVDSVGALRTKLPFDGCHGKPWCTRVSSQPGQRERRARLHERGKPRSNLS